MGKIDLKYNISNIKIFLNIFDLELEEAEHNNLHIFMNDITVGKVAFRENDILIKTKCLWGDLNATVNYADAITLTDPESFSTIGKMGLFASWNNVFIFDLKFLNGNNFSGNFQFGIKIDNEFGNMVSPHFKLNYKDNEKEYLIKIQDDGKPFSFLEKRGNFEEMIIYSIFSSYSTGSYMYHLKKDYFKDGDKDLRYCEFAKISDSFDNKNQNSAVVHKEFNENWIIHNYQDFSKKSDQSEDLPEELINRANFMQFISPQTIEKIHKLIAEFSIEGVSFIEKMILYAFHYYSEEEVFALFALDKNSIDLEKLYFGDENKESLTRKIFLSQKD